MADEVFADYPLEVKAPPTESVMNLDVLSFTLGGASKSLGLPQIKLGWMVVGGPQADRARALAALEIIADTFLSVGTSVQGAAPSLLARGLSSGIRFAVASAPTWLAPESWRVSALRARSCRSKAGGPSWFECPRSAPRRRSQLELLERERVLVHPGYFFDFPHEAFIVVSLIPPPDQFADAFARTLSFVDRLRR